MTRGAISSNNGRTMRAGAEEVLGPDAEAALRLSAKRHTGALITRSTRGFRRLRGTYRLRSTSDAGRRGYRGDLHRTSSLDQSPATCRLTQVS